jgi:predicted NACHT family NTPase
MLRSADFLVQLMKQQIDALVAQDPYLQEFLTWASQKSLVTPQPTLAATRAFYLGLTQTPHLAPHFALACTLDRGIFLDALLDNLVLECAISSSR